MELSWWTYRFSRACYHYAVFNYFSVPDSNTSHVRSFLESNHLTGVHSKTREIFRAILFLIVIRLSGQTKVYREPWKSSPGVVEGSALPDNLHPLESLLEKWAMHHVPYGNVASAHNAIGFMRSCRFPTMKLWTRIVGLNQEFFFEWRDPRCWWDAGMHFGAIYGW